MESGTEFVVRTVPKREIACIAQLTNALSSRTANQQCSTLLSGNAFVDAGSFTYEVEDFDVIISLDDRVASANTNA